VPRLFPLLIALSGCADHAYDVTADVDGDVSTRVMVSWTTDEPGVSWVEFGGVGLEDMSTPTSDGERVRHEHMLLGLPAFQDVWYRAITVVDGVERSVSGALTTGGLPAELPEFTVTVDRPELRSNRPYLMGTSFGLVPALFAIDRQGQWLWYQLLDAGQMPVEMERERDGDGFLYNSFSSDYSVDGSTVQRADFEGGATWQHETALGHHAFTQLPDGATAWLTLDVRDWSHPDVDETWSVVGDAIVVLDSEGEEHTVFTTWDWLEPIYSPEWETDFYGLGKDWTHANALRWNEVRGTLTLSLRNLDTVVELELDTETWQATPVRQLGGEPEWALVDPRELYQVPGSAVGIDHLHDPSWTEDGDLLAMVQGQEETLAVSWALDDAEHALVETWRHGDGLGLESIFLGMARDLPNGNRLVVYSSAGVIQEVTRDGEVAWELQGSAGALFGNALLFYDFYAP
jgi:hypothetical protein